MNNSKVVAETHTVDEYNPPRPIIHHEHHERCPPSLDRLPSRTGLDHDITSTQDHSMTENVEPTAAVLQQQPREAGDNKILILGPTGVGKSSFISLMTGCNVPIGHDIISCTSECKPYGSQDSDGEKYTLIDTPGFDDSSRDDMEILGSIAKYLVKDDRSSITGIIYIQRITDRKMTGTSVLNLKILKRLCGEHFYPSVALVSSMWNSIPNDRINRQCETREHRLIDSEFWGDMVSGGSKTFRFEGDRASGLRIIKHFTGNNHDHMSVPQFVRELLTKSTLESTSAGQIIVEERMRREQKRLEEIEEEMQCVKSQKAEYQEESNRLQRNQDLGRRMPEDHQRRHELSPQRASSEQRIHDSSVLRREREGRHGRSPGGDRRRFQRRHDRDTLLSVSALGIEVAVKRR